VKSILPAVLLLPSAFLAAQNDTTKKLTFSGYAEIYYSYDFAKPQNHEKENFIYNHKRHNEVNANLVMLKAAYAGANSRANLGFMAGNYAQYNLSAEPSWAQFIYEANVGVKLSKKRSIWLDAGIMPSHIGFESAVGADCWTLTRSIMAESSPYYETGVKLSFTSKKENLYLAFMVLNGWQRIKKPDYIQAPSFGMQVNYKPADAVTLNYSNFIGTDRADSLKSLRTFHNFYLQFEPKSKLGLIAGFDIGTDKYNAADYGIWFSPVVIVRYSLNDKARIALRGEYYNDKNQVIISTNLPGGFRVSGLSANFDYKITQMIQCRIEGKIYNSQDRIFKNNRKDNGALTASMTIKI
jgi:Putative beta-barrel porin-2, OmpL-like. bbp2